MAYQWITIDEAIEMFHAVSAERLIQLIDEGKIDRGPDRGSGEDALMQVSYSQVSARFPKKDTRQVRSGEIRGYVEGAIVGLAASEGLDLLKAGATGYRASKSVYSLSGGPHSIEFRIERSSYDFLRQRYMIRFRNEAEILGACLIYLIDNFRRYDALLSMRDIEVSASSVEVTAVLPTTVLYAVEVISKGIELPIQQTCGNLIDRLAAGEIRISHSAIIGCIRRIRFSL